MTVTWIVVPGLAETPEEFGRVVELLPGEDVRVIDPWRTPISSDVDALRAAAGVQADAEIGLVGHSIGGLAVLRWALTRPYEVTRLALVDTSLTSETGLRAFYPGKRGDRAVRAAARFLGRVGVPRLLGPAVRRLIVRLGSMSNHDLLSKATARARYGGESSWLLFWGELDQHIPAEHRNQVMKAMREADKEYVDVLFSKADHGFFCDARQSYQQNAARLSWDTT